MRRTPRDPIGTGTPGEPTEAAQAGTCGPNASRRVREVWRQIQTDFAVWPEADKQASCHRLVAPVITDESGEGEPAEDYLSEHVPEFLREPLRRALPDTAIINKDAFDTIGLYQYSMDYVRRPPIHPPCAVPGSTNPAGDSGDPGHEDPDTCSNTVQVGSDCWLSGTANYGTYGVMMRLCSDHFLSSALFRVSPLRVNPYSEAAMSALVMAYKRLDGEDSTDPLNWARANYRNGPTTSVSGGNRPHCATTCPLAISNQVPRFSYVWEPTVPR